MKIDISTSTKHFSCNIEKLNVRVEWQSLMSIFTIETRKAISSHFYSLSVRSFTNFCHIAEKTGALEISIWLRQHAESLHLKFS